MYIPLWVTQQKTLAVVDTAAHVSVMSRKFFKTLAPAPKLIEKIILKGIGENSQLEAEKTTNIRLKIGNLRTKWSFVVADITDEIILGIDFLQHYNAVIDLTDYSVKLRGEVAELILTKDNETMKIYRVKLANRTTVPPASNKLSTVEFDTEPDSETVIQPTRFMKKLLIPNMLCKGNKEVPIMLKNPTDEYITLKKGYQIGVGVEVSATLQDDNTDRLVAVNKVEVKAENIPEYEQLKRLEEQLPDHIKELFRRSISK